MPNGTCCVGCTHIFALDKSLSALSRVQESFGSFLLGKVVSVSAKAEAAVRKGAVVGAEAAGAVGGWREGARGGSLLGHPSGRGLCGGARLYVALLWGRTG